MYENAVMKPILKAAAAGTLGISLGLLLAGMVRQDMEIRHLQTLCHNNGKLLHGNSCTLFRRLKLVEQKTDRCEDACRQGHVHPDLERRIAGMEKNRKREHRIQTQELQKIDDRLNRLALRFLSAENSTGIPSCLLPDLSGTVILYGVPVACLPGTMFLPAKNQLPAVLRNKLRTKLQWKQNGCILKGDAVGIALLPDQAQPRSCVYYHESEVVDRNSIG